LYCGGTITGTCTNGIYTEITGYEGGTQMGHRGIMQGGGRPGFGGQRPEGMNPGQRPDRQPDNAPQRPQGERPENFDPNNLPEGFEPSAMPQGAFGGFGGGFNADTPLTADFIIDSENRVYAGIAAMQ